MFTKTRITVCSFFINATVYASPTVESKFEAPSLNDANDGVVVSSVGIELSQEAINSAMLSKIRVRIFPHDRDFAPQFVDHLRSKIAIESSGLCAVYEGQQEKADSAAKLITRVRHIELDASTLRVPLWIRCHKPFVLKRAPDKRSFSYEGDLYVRPEVVDGRAQLLAINVIDLESYLRGVVPTEVMAGWPLETLKSQAVAARTYAIFHMSYARKNHAKRLYDVDDSIVYQAYTGTTQYNRRTDQAVYETKGQVILYGNQIIQAYYHADSGGMTAAADHSFFRTIPYCTSKTEPYDLSLVKSDWQFRYSPADVTSKLRRRGVLKANEQIKEIMIRPEDRHLSGRVKAVQLILVDGTVRSVSVHHFKRAIHLLSNYFSVVLELDSQTQAQVFVFSGRGSGHGVGLNQMGAKVLAEQYSWDYARILKFYYSNTQVCTLDAETSGVSVPNCLADRS